MRPALRALIQMYGRRYAPEVFVETSTLDHPLKRLKRSDRLYTRDGFVIVSRIVGRCSGMKNRLACLNASPPDDYLVCATHFPAVSLDQTELVARPSLC